MQFLYNLLGFITAVYIIYPVTLLIHLLIYYVVIVLLNYNLVILIVFECTLLICF